MKEVLLLTRKKQSTKRMKQKLTRPPMMARVPTVVQCAHRSQRLPRKGATVVPRGRVRGPWRRPRTGVDGRAAQRRPSPPPQRGHDGRPPGTRPGPWALSPPERRRSNSTHAAVGASTARARRSSTANAAVAPGDVLAEAPTDVQRARGRRRLSSQGAMVDHRERGLGRLWLRARRPRRGEFGQGCFKILMTGGGGRSEAVSFFRRVAADTHRHVVRPCGDGRWTEASAEKGQRGEARETFSHGASAGRVGRRRSSTFRCHLVGSPPGTSAAGSFSSLARRARASSRRGG